MWSKILLCLSISGLLQAQELKGVQAQEPKGRVLQK